MLSRELRFNFRKPLPRNTLSFPSFNIRYEKNTLGKLQVAVVVSKKVDKRAVVRNRLKRVLLTKVGEELAENDAINAVFYIKKAATDESAMLVDLEKALYKITHETKVSG